MILDNLRPSVVSAKCEKLCGQRRVIVITFLPLLTDNDKEGITLVNTNSRINNICFILICHKNR